MRRAVNLTAWVVTFGVLVTVIFACVVGETPLTWLSRGGLTQALVRREQCRDSVQSLELIGAALVRYQAQFGQLPPDLPDLERASLSPGVLESPLGGRYVLTGRPMGQGHWMVCRELDVPGGGGHVLYADGRIAWVPDP